MQAATPEGAAAYFSLPGDCAEAVRQATPACLAANFLSWLRRRRAHPYPFGRPRGTRATEPEPIARSVPETKLRSVGVTFFRRAALLVSEPLAPIDDHSLAGHEVRAQQAHDRLRHVLCCGHSTQRRG